MTHRSEAKFLFNQFKDEWGLIEVWLSKKFHPIKIHIQVITHYDQLSTNNKTKSLPRVNSQYLMSKANHYIVSKIPKKFFFMNFWKFWNELQFLSKVYLNFASGWWGVCHYLIFVKLLTPEFGVLLVLQK